MLEKVFKHLNVLEKDYFGLRYIDRSSQSVCQACTLIFSKTC